jgi:hypothetical protein
VTVDHTAGEPRYPIGWPRISHSIPAGPSRDWSAWDALQIWIYTETSRAALPREPAVLILHNPDRAGAYVRPLSELRKGEWVEIRIPLAQIPRHRDIRLLQLSISEADYRHQDRLDFYIADLALLRYVRPVLLEFAPESAVAFADAGRLPVRFRLAGLPPGESAPVTCELRRGDRIAARSVMRAGRGPQRLVLDLEQSSKTERGLPPGLYELTARVAGSRRPATGRVRLVESPWE